MVRTWLIDAAGELVCREFATAPLEGDCVSVEVHGTVIGPRERAALVASPRFIPGGAAVGMVVDTGNAATQMLGKRVLVGPVMPCGECETCRRGAAAACPHADCLGVTVNGTLASHVVARARWVLLLEDKLDIPAGPNAAILAREVANAYAAFAQAGISPNEPVIIVGDNALAKFVAQVANAKGAQPFAYSSDVAQDINQCITAAGHANKPRRIFETSGTAGARRLALRLANPGATVVLLSQQAASTIDADDNVEVEVDDLINASEDWVSNHVTVLGIAGAHPDFAAEVVAMAIRNQLDITTSTQLFTVDQLPEVIANGGKNPQVPILDLRQR